MSNNIMSMMRLKNKTSYNGFDLSTKRNYTQKMGQLYPLWWQYCIPGDKVKVDLSAFTRTVPVNTAAFARIRQYFDFYFVPLEFLWNKSFCMLQYLMSNRLNETFFLWPPDAEARRESIESDKSVSPMPER